MCLLPSMVESSKGKDEVYDRMLLDYFLSYHQFIHLLCRIAINCEKFTDTLVKLSVLIALLWLNACEAAVRDPAFSEYIKCILMDERMFLNNNVAYSFLTCFLHKVQLLQPELAAHRLELSKTSSLLNGDLRALVLLLSVQPPQAVDPALCPALQELLGRCRVCVQQRSSLELEAKDHKAKGFVATSTSDTETRDSSSLIDPGTEQDPPSPDPAPASSGNLDSSPKEEKMEASSSSSSSFSSSSSLLQEAGEGFVQGEEPEAPPSRHVASGEEEDEEGRRGEAVSASSEEVKEEKEAGSKTSSNSAPPLSEDAAFPSALGLVGEGPEGCGSHTPSSQVFPSAGPPPDMLDMLYRTVEATIAIVTKLSVKGPPSS
ncbi:ubiquitin carboxyl-terminal hydrolase 34 isoform X1 [Lates japonicus]|uniref:Ubiquitin carboxyl-terminal hydrolase 34 isoform X1 n=1 Tax=Lates japonicus TaxID=270547 RepID=A0AAD3NAX4_LATJO|nr:ubiquitin carboxyl-terminal hydrolase 34 isoform X1 [Lates japonicus]